MSFGDIVPALPPSPASLPPPAIAELQRLLKPLAANNASLRHATARLRSDTSDPALHLKRLRALREQNRQIARAAAGISSSVDMQLVGRKPDVLEKANDAKKQFQQLLDEFSNALTESVTVEREVLEKSAKNKSVGRSADTTQTMSENQVALEAEKPITPSASESDPLLPKPSAQALRNQAALREIQSNDSFVRERDAVLVDVQSSIDDVNAIFKDLAVMINDQRTQIDHVEVAIGETAHNVSGARRELERTERRRESRKRFFFVTLLSIAGIIALFLIFLLS